MVDDLRYAIIGRTKAIEYHNKFGGGSDGKHEHFLNVLKHCLQENESKCQIKTRKQRLMDSNYSNSETCLFASIGTIGEELNVETDVALSSSNEEELDEVIFGLTNYPSIFWISQ